MPLTGSSASIGRTSSTARALLDRFCIWTAAIDGAGVRGGVRMTPQFFIVPAELDAPVRALRAIAA